MLRERETRMGIREHSRSTVLGLYGWLPHGPPDRSKTRQERQERQPFAGNGEPSSMCTFAGVLFLSPTNLTRHPLKAPGRQPKPTMQNFQVIIRINKPDHDWTVAAN